MSDTINYGRRASDNVDELGREKTRRIADNGEKWKVMVIKPDGGIKMGRGTTFAKAMRTFDKTLKECKFGYRVQLIKIVSDEISMTGEDGKVLGT